MSDLIQEFISIQEGLSGLYEKRKDLIARAIKDNNGPLIKENEDGTWTRINIYDNKERVDEGYFEFVKVERYSIKIENLKNKPKELK